MGQLGWKAEEVQEVFQSTHPVWDGTALAVLAECTQRISIHPSRVGWDNSHTIGIECRPISIHPSRVGWDQKACRHPRCQTYFNPPIPCGMGRRWSRRTLDIPVISIHPSRVGWDISPFSTVGCCRIFQSTHPVWDGTTCISNCNAQRGYFNPPIPCGMGRGVIISHLVICLFQSTHPVWDGTGRHRHRHQDLSISIHPSRVGWDQASPSPAVGVYISIHPSRVGWDSASTL